MSITGEWVPWQSKVPQIEVETHKVAAPDVVVPTLDTVRHEALLYTWLAEHKPLVLCGPPGSGKTMTLFSALRALPDMEVTILKSNLGMITSFCRPLPLTKSAAEFADVLKQEKRLLLLKIDVEQSESTP